MRLWGRRKTTEVVETAPVDSPEEIRRKELLFQNLGTTAVRPLTAEAEASHMWVLPETWRVAQYPNEMQEFASVAKRFPRVIRFDPPVIRGGMRLIDILSRAEDQFDLIAGFCGARVVSHDWALADQSVHPRARHNQPRPIPAGYMLVAQVEAIRDITPLTEEMAELVISGVQTYNERNRSHPYHLRDLGPQQFSYGTVGASPEPQLVMHDLDLRFG